MITNPQNWWRSWTYISITRASWARLWHPTWHDDIREAQFPGDGHTPSEEDHVLSSQLLYVPVEELESHRQTWQEEQWQISKSERSHSSI